MKLPFGKKVTLGSFYVLKHNRSLSSKEAKALRKAEGLPPEIIKALDRRSLPYIKVSTMSESWSVEFVAGMCMYDAIDEIEVAVDGEGVYTYYGEAYQTMGNIINGWLAYTSTVGDAQYQADVVKAMQSYLKRAADKEKAPLSKEENEKAVEEAASYEGRLRTLKEMSKSVNIKTTGND